MQTPDYYDILGVARDASDADIKAAFRHKAKELHPDFGGDPEAFRQLMTAYDVLGDPNNRRHYDVTGEAPTDAADNARFRALVGDWLVAAVAQAGAPQFDDILALMRRSLTQHIAGIDQQIAQLKSLAVKMRVAAERFHTDAEENLLRGLLLERQKKLGETISELKEQSARLRRVFELLEAYSYSIFVESVP
jgi:curved DNA-binding protein CbpA